MNCSPELCGWVTDVPDGEILVGYVWYCGDEWCDCSEPRINSYKPGDFNGPLMLNPKRVWSGTFQTDGDGWRDANQYKDAPSSTTELNRMAQHLRRHHHDLYARIRWPWAAP